MKRPNTLVSTCITALFCFGVGFIVSSVLSKHRLDAAAEKAEVGDDAMNVVVNLKRQSFDLYRQLRSVKGELKTAEGEVRVVRLPAQVVRLPGRAITKYVRVASLPPVRHASSTSQIGSLTSLARSASVPAAPAPNLHPSFGADRNPVVEATSHTSADAQPVQVVRSIPINAQMIKNVRYDPKTNVEFYYRNQNQDQNTDQNLYQNRTQNFYDRCFKFVWR